MTDIQDQAIRFLRWSEKYTKTDMVYLARAGFWSTSGGVIASVFSLLLSIAFANFLPSDVFGTYQYLISISAILTAICLTGMNGAISQSTARGFEGDLRASVRVQMMWSIVPILGGLIAASYYFVQGNHLLAFGLIVISLLAPLTNVFNTYNAFLQGKKEFKRIFTYTMAINATYYLFMFPTVIFFHQAIALIFINLATNLAAVTYFYFRTLRVYRPNNETDARTIPYGIHLSIMNVLSSIITQLDSILVFHFLGPVELAVYSFASMVPERVASLFKFATTAALPKFATQTHAEIQRYIISKTLRAAVIGAVATIAYIVSAPLIFHILFPHYVSAIFYSQLYAAYIITVAAGIPMAAMDAMRIQRELYLFNTVTPLILLTLQVWLLLQFGIAGILLARVISNTFNICLAIFLTRHPFLSKKSSA